MESMNESLEKLAKYLKPRKVVSCPESPAIVTASDTGVTIETGDTMGLVFKIAVPKSGVIYSATLYDFDDEGIQIDIEIFKKPVADIATDSAFAPTDTEGLFHLTELSFVSFDDHGVYQTAELTNIGKAYTAPEGIFHIQAVVRGGTTIAVGSPYRIQLQILSDDPDFGG